MRPGRAMPGRILIFCAPPRRLYQDYASMRRSADFPVRSNSPVAIGSLLTKLRVRKSDTAADWKVRAPTHAPVPKKCGPLTLWNELARLPDDDFAGVHWHWASSFQSVSGPH